MKKALIIIDMQNDFITGSLANKAAEAIVDPIVEKIKSFDGDVIATRDSHTESYLQSAEGKKLPYKHCIEYTDGWKIHPSIMDAMVKKRNCRIINKTTFGFVGSWELYAYDSIEIVGTCTEICVISNALILKAMYPEKKIAVIDELCAGVTKENHDAAIKVMKSCQIDIE